MKTINALAKKIFETTSDYASTLGEEIIKDLTDDAVIKVFPEGFDLPAYDASAIDGKEVSNPESVGIAAPAEGLSVFRSVELPGGMALVSRHPKAELKGKDAIAVIGSVGTVVAQYDSKAAEPSKHDLQTLTTDTAASIAKSVSELATAVLGYKAHQAKLTEIKKKILAAGGALGKKTDVTDEEKASIAALQKVAGSVPRWIDSPAKDFARYSLNTGKAMLDYVEESLKQQQPRKEALAAPAAPAAKPEEPVAA